jgi:hypothetical protein
MMDKLPTELLCQIISHVSQTSLTQLRLVSRAFDALSFTLVFSHIPQWLDYEISHRRVLTIALDAYNRPAVMWSPWATAPDHPCHKIWLGIVWRVLTGKKMSEDDSQGTGLTACNFAVLSGRENMDEKRLRTGQNRFLMHRSYVRGTQEEDHMKPHMEVVRLESKSKW